MFRPDVQVIFGDLLDGILGAIADFFGAILGAIGEVFVAACDAVFGSGRLVIVIPSGLVTAALLGFGYRALTEDGSGALLSPTTFVIIGVIFLFFLIAILIAAARRRKRS